MAARVENTAGKGEIAHYEQFLLFPLCFQKAYFQGASKGVIVWEWVKWQCQRYIPMFLCEKGVYASMELVKVKSTDIYHSMRKLHPFT